MTKASHRATPPGSNWVPRHQRPLLRGAPCVLGTALAVPALLHLIEHARPGLPTRVALVYSATVFLLLAVSALYHTPPWNLRVHDLLRRIDHGNIYLMIAGSYTPLAVSLPEPTGTIALWLSWTGAALGALMAWVWTGLRREARSAIYVILGLSTALPSALILDTCGLRILVLYWGGGLLYILGATIYALRRPDPWPRTFGHHEIFHMLVVVAAVLHYVAAWILLT